LSGYAAVRAEMDAVRAEAPWILRTDEPLLDVFISQLTTFRYTADAFARMTETARSRSVNAAKLQLRRAKLLGELADRLGLSPQSRFKLGLVVAKTEVVRVQPVRSEDRARRVAELLARSGALPQIAQPADPEDVPMTERRRR
jgi:AraC-like DNA-binding protein